MGGIHINDPGNGYIAKQVRIDRDAECRLGGADDAAINPTWSHRGTANADPERIMVRCRHQPGPPMVEPLRQMRRQIFWQCAREVAVSFDFGGLKIETIARAIKDQVLIDPDHGEIAEPDGTVDQDRNHQGVAVGEGVLCALYRALIQGIEPPQCPAENAGAIIHH